MEEISVVGDLGLDVGMSMVFNVVLEFVVCR